MKSITEIINETIPLAMRIVLQQSGMNLTEDTSARSHYDLFVLIGFSQDGFDGLNGFGTLGFSADQSILNAVYGESETKLSDGWLEEIANQLLGRLKNTLLTYGTEINVTPPKILRGIQCQVGPDTRQKKHFRYNSEFGHCCTWVDPNWDYIHDLKLMRVEERPQAEGEMILF